MSTNQVQSGVKVVEKATDAVIQITNSDVIRLLVGVGKQGAVVSVLKQYGLQITVTTKDTVQDNLIAKPDWTEIATAPPDKQVDLAKALLANMVPVGNTYKLAVLLPDNHTVVVYELDSAAYEKIMSEFDKIAANLKNEVAERVGFLEKVVDNLAQFLKQNLVSKEAIDSLPENHPMKPALEKLSQLTVGDTLIALSAALVFGAIALLLYKLLIKLLIKGAVKTLARETLEPITENAELEALNTLIDNTLMIERLLGPTYVYGKDMMAKESLNVAELTPLFAVLALLAIFVYFIVAVATGDDNKGLVAAAAFLLVAAGIIGIASDQIVAMLKNLANDMMNTPAAYVGVALLGVAVFFIVRAIRRMSTNPSFIVNQPLTPPHHVTPEMARGAFIMGYANQNVSKVTRML